MAEMASFNGVTSKTILNVKGITFSDSKNMLRATGKVLIRLQGKWPKRYIPGDLLAIRLVLKRPESYLSPGSFDYPRYLAQKDIWITGFIASPLLIEEIIEKQTNYHRVRYVSERVRVHIAESIDQSLPGETGALYKALLLGERGGISDETLEHFKKSGVLHILAISGIHMAVAGSLFYFLLFFLLSRSEYLLLNYSVHIIATLLTLPFLFCYALLAGSNTPVIRALIMTTIVIAALCTHRIKSRSTLVSAAALLILFIAPVQLFTVSFQLSFTAVLAILAIGPTLQKSSAAFDERYCDSPRLGWIIKWVIAGTLVSIVATFATAPISVATFNRVSIIGIAANLFIEPLLCLWALSFGMVGIVFTFFSSTISSFFFNFGALGIDLAVHIVKFFSSFRFACLWMPLPPFWTIVIYYLLLFTVILSDGLRLKCRLALSGVLIIWIYYSFQLFPGQQRVSPDHARISFISVGQGTSTLLQSGNGETILIDGGSSGYTGSSIGERVIARFLWAKGIRTIDAILITHPDADHYNGLNYIAEHFSPGLIWTKVKSTKNQNYEELLSTGEQNGAIVQIPKTGDEFGKELSVRSLYTFPGDNKVSEKNKKKAYFNSGLVLQVCFKDTCILFPGDIEADAEKQLIKKQIPLNSKILLAAHHGSITSNTDIFLDSVLPEVLIVSSGNNRSKHFPHPSLLSKAEKLGIETYTTAANGTIEIELAEGKGTLWNYYRPLGNPLYKIQKKWLADLK
jgi:competence protein ComEC